MRWWEMEDILLEQLETWLEWDESPTRFLNVGINSINHSVSKIDLTRFMDDWIFIRVI